MNDKQFNQLMWLFLCARKGAKRLVIAVLVLSISTFVIGLYVGKGVAARKYTEDTAQRPIVNHYYYYYNSDNNEKPALPYYKDKTDAPTSDAFAPNDTSDSGPYVGSGSSDANAPKDKPSKGNYTTYEDSSHMTYEEYKQAQKALQEEADRANNMTYEEYVKEYTERSGELDGLGFGYTPYKPKSKEIEK